MEGNRGRGILKIHDLCVFKQMRRDCICEIKECYLKRRKMNSWLVEGLKDKVKVFFKQRDRRSERK
jgi:hypothetical protein